MKYLRPMRLREKFFAPVEAEIQRILNKIIYAPLQAVLNEYGPGYEIRNTRNTSLVAAIRSGQVWYTAGAFHGQFNAQLTAELRGLGARYNRHARTWSLPSDEVPPQVKFAQADADDRSEQLRKQIVTTLDDMHVDFVGSESNLESIYEGVLGEMEKEFAGTVPPRAIDAISVQAQVTPAAREAIAKEWANNLELYIQGWAEENILQLREDIKKPILGGARAASFEGMLQHNYGVSKRKAKFLARQETSLLMSKYHETKCRDLGITRYRWGGANDERERPDHRALNGKVFSFDDPPITDRRTGARNNPGEDFNCRCVAIPIVE